MLKTEAFKPQHIHAAPEDLAGNQGIGRYIFLPGSSGRAKEILKQIATKPNLLGQKLQAAGMDIDLINSLITELNSASIEVQSCQQTTSVIFQTLGKKYFKMVDEGVERDVEFGASKPLFKGTIIKRSDGRTFADSEQRDKAIEKLQKGFDARNQELEMYRSISP